MDPNLRVCLLFLAAGAMLALFAFSILTLLSSEGTDQPTRMSALDCGVTKCFHQRIPQH